MSQLMGLVFRTVARGTSPFGYRRDRSLGAFGDQSHTACMCNLYRMQASVDELRQAFGAFDGDRSNLGPRDEIYPSQKAPVLRLIKGMLTLDEIEWGVPPPVSASGSVTNVRNLSSPFWRPMLTNPQQRCLVAWTQFCEWTGPKGSKRKVWFERTDTGVSAFAGLSRNTSERPRMAFLTTEVNDTIGAIHPRAIPVILEADSHERWLTGDYDVAAGLARPFDDSRTVTIDES
ncbi:SOS response-associated peptidase [Novosphingopyxis sp. YJ-S2-01]|uniref:SOS response-associated peptidase n=1 Tax=Novosphingopyxis sp. YJ-S2-01 TaxID=2794021 RepID=UPI0018DE4BC0|nr:SOS response-associated peptidase family protein [Novosphingopyxis sp. YJ-S2-01]